MAEANDPTKDCAATVFVERGVAKMTVATPGTTGTIIVKDKANPTATTKKSEVTFSNWALDITNKKTYAVHNIDGLNTDFPDIWTTARFTGTNNRVYWGTDPNYNLAGLNTADEANDTKREGEFNFITATSDINKAFDKPVYCLENTFNLANMYQGQTTRVIFKATYVPKKDDTAGTSLADADGTFYTIGNMTTILKLEDLKTAVDAAAHAVLPGCVVDYKNLEKEGSHVITLEDIKENASSTTHLDGATKYGTGLKTGEDIVKDINDKLGLTDGEGLAKGRPEAKVGINTYKKGVTYYIARVKHFGDALTKWNSGEPYGDNNKQYLGRYGMLRNNWYELTVGNVYGPGYPGVPPVDPTLPDDENEKYLSVSVKILSWAKRSQKVDL